MTTFKTRALHNECTPHLRADPVSDKLTAFKVDAFVTRALKLLGVESILSCAHHLAKA